MLSTNNFYKFSVTAVGVVAVSLLILSVGIFADTSGPGSPTFNGCPGSPNAKGPCTDPHTYKAAGTGNGWCGRCSSISYSYDGGVCLGTHPIGDDNCTNCTVTPKVTNRVYQSTPVGALMFAGCFTELALCGAGDAAIGVACGGVCYTLGVFTGGVSCYLCIAGTGLVGAACVCTFEECAETCEYITTEGFGSTSACQ